MAAIVAEDEPFVARDFDGSEIIFIPILFVGFVDGVATQA